MQKINSSQIWTILCSIPDSPGCVWIVQGRITETDSSDYGDLGSHRLESLQGSSDAILSKLEGYTDAVVWILGATTSKGRKRLLAKFNHGTFQQLHASSYIQVLTHIYWQDEVFLTWSIDTHDILCPTHHHRSNTCSSLWASQNHLSRPTKSSWDIR